jgi:F-type H+-transporting ATPase subunit epsilon
VRQLTLQIVTPREQLVQATCTSVTVPGELGEFQILPGHAALLSLVRIGELTYEAEDGTMARVRVGEGHTEVVDDCVTVSVDSAVAG